MKYLFILLTTINFSWTAFAQEEEEDPWAQESVIQGMEIGFDVTASASNFGGDVGIGLKYGINLGEYFIVGPSIRYEYLWWKNYYNTTASTTGNYHMYGGGAFVHARFYNAVYLGAEFEMLRSPYQTNGLINSLNATWAPTLFVGGGYSQEFNERIRINAGIMYDVINAANSPFRRSYFVQKKTSTGAVTGYLPIIYRIAFFFPIR